jgi:ribosome biogenesis GTPase
MGKWRYGKDTDNFEKISKFKKRKKTHVNVELTESFEKSEKDWDLTQKDAFIGRVVEVHKRYCFVSVENERGQIDTRDVWLAEVVRKFLVADRNERNFVAVGDRVLCHPSEDVNIELAKDLPRCIIQHLSPRVSKISRIDPHQKTLEHVLATNMDQIMIVASVQHPKVKWGLIDRYIVMAESEGIGSILVLNKKDLIDADPKEEFKEEFLATLKIYRDLGYPVFFVQASADDASEDEDIKSLQSLLVDKVTLLSGHSGVGKSSLVNLFAPEIVQPVEENPDIFYKGRHTTTYASFIKLGTGGYVIDTPGIRSFTFDEKSSIELSYCFIEMRPYLGQCKFRECKHLDEPECVIRQAVTEGKISEWRYRSYIGILQGATGREGRMRDIDIGE